MRRHPRELSPPGIGIGISLGLSLLLGACSLPSPSVSALQLRGAGAAAPSACAPLGSEAKLQLPATPASKNSNSAEALDLAQVYTVNRPLQEVAVWQDREDGWSLLSLQIGSAHARSIAVRLREVKLPGATQAWLCGSTARQGPFTEAPKGELWTPVVAGEQARLEVWVPTAQRGEFTAMLADVYGGYR